MLLLHAAILIKFNTSDKFMLNYDMIALNKILARTLACALYWSNLEEQIFHYKTL